jgi:hypothetical protein
MNLKLLSLIGLTLAPFVFGAPQDCRKDLESSLCYTTDVSHWLEYSGPYKTNALKAFQNRSCGNFPLNRKKEILEVFDSLPADVKKAFCHIKKVYLVRDAHSYGARASYSYDESSVKFKTTGPTVNFSGSSNGYILEISEPARFKNESGEDFKSRVSWARFQDDHTISRDLSFEWDLPSFQSKSEALATTIVHEVGHFLSRANGLYLLSSQEKASAWTKLSWSIGAGYFTPKKESDFSIWTSIKMKSISPREIRTLTDYLLRTGEASLYSVDNPEESFAEHFMFHFYPRFKMLYQGKVILDVEKEYQNPRSALSVKRNFILGLLKQREDPFRQLNYVHNRVYSP